MSIRETAEYQDALARLRATPRDWHLERGQFIHRLGVLDDHPHSAMGLGCVTAPALYYPVMHAALGLPFMATADAKEYYASPAEVMAIRADLLAACGIEEAKP